MTEGYSGQKGLSTRTSHYNVLAFIFQQLLAEFRTVTLAKVEAVHDAEGNDITPGSISPAGFVDVTPLVNSVDGTNGNPQKQGKVFGLPYFRLQGGNNAVILDPAVGDIGMIAICDRDISSVKSNKDQANPGSFRRGSFADGIYLGGILNDAPTQYVTFTDQGMEIHDKNGNDITTNDQGVVITDANSNTVTMAAGEITVKSTTVVIDAPNASTTGNLSVGGNLAIDGVVTGKTTATQISINSPVKVSNTLQVTQAITADSTITATGEITANGKTVSTHVHSGVTAGAADTGPPV